MTSSINGNLHQTPVADIYKESTSKKTEETGQQLSSFHFISFHGEQYEVKPEIDGENNLHQLVAGLMKKPGNYSAY